MICPHCLDSGSVTPNCLDCAYCDIAMERATLNASMAALSSMFYEDAIWHAYKLGKASAEQQSQPEGKMQ